MSRTAHSRPPGRMISIRQGFGQERIVSNRRASSLKQGLLDFYKGTLQHYGYTKPKVIGNVLTVETIYGERTYIATEAK